MSTGNVLAFRSPSGTGPSEGPEALPYAELLATSNFSFLYGASHPGELVAQAVGLGLAGLGLCDRNSFAGVVRGYTALRDLRESEEFGEQARSFRYVVGVRLVFADDTPDIIAYPTDRDAYGLLCSLLTIGNMRAEKGDCILSFSDLAAHAEGQLFILKADEKRLDASAGILKALNGMAPGNVWLAADCDFQGRDRMRLNRLAALADAAGVPLIATNDALYHEPGRRVLQDVVTCIRQHLTIAEAGRRLHRNGERHIKPPAEMARLFREHPAALAETQTLLSRIGFVLDDLRYNYPEETVGNGETAQETLERLTWEGAAKRYPRGVPDQVKAGVWSELCLIAYKSYAPYFLTVHDIVRHAREDLEILCQGRGSAANSMVCFCLGVTEVDPMIGKLVFGRFLSTERDEPPDIDIDFEHERREEVMQYLYNKYGRDRTGLTATVVSYRSRGALRDVAKVFGLSSDTVTALNGLSWGSQDGKPRSQRISELGYDPDEPTLSKVLDIVGDLMEFPRHLSQHVGGFVITRDRLDHLVPIANAAMENRTVVEWDKDDLDALGILKVDVLALGMLTCLKRAFDLMAKHYDQPGLTVAGILQEERDDEERRDRGEKTQSDRVYAMAQRADTIGVFQIESRAQMSMLPRLKPEKFYDLVIEVAIVRPGPIQGGMVHPYLKRRLGLEDADCPSDELREVLERTKGIPLFQEQAMQIAVVAAGFSAAKADGLRRAMATWRRNGRIFELKEDFISGMLANNYTRDFAERCFKQIEGFGDYGFPESHAASFAALVYVSCWLKCHYPDVFACALINSQPMGFYAPAQIIRDAREHGVEIRPVDINVSHPESVLEPGRRAADHLWPRHGEMAGDIYSNHAIRLGFSMIKGLGDNDIDLIVARRGAGYASVRDLWLRTGLAPAVLEKLAEADGFTSLGLGRRDALWAIKGLVGTDGAEALPLFAAAGLPAARSDEKTDLPAMTPGEAVIEDYKSLSLSLKGHPVQFLREDFARRGIIPAADLAGTPPGAIVTVAGLVLVRQRPGTASGIIFMTLEDETGIANIVVWNKIFEANRRRVLGSRLVAVRGRVQREGLVVHVVAASFFDFTPDLMALARGEDGQKTRRLELDHAARAALPSGRNFH